MRPTINRIKATTMSIRNAFRLLFVELDEINARLDKLEGLETTAPIELDEINADNFKECNDKDKLEEFAKTLELEIDKRKSVENIIADIETKINEGAE